MSQPSDWEPLSAEERASCPGELVAVPARQSSDGVSMPRPTAGSGPVPTGASNTLPKPRALAAEPAVDAAAEQALQELKQRIRKATVSHSLVAEVARREARQERKQRAAHVASLATCKPLQGAVLTKDQPLDIEYATGEDGRDPREEQPWFTALPEEERERLRGAWTSKRQQAAAMQPLQRRNQNRRTVAGILAFVAVLFLGTGGAWYATLGAGIGCGIAWRYASPCRYRDPVIAFGCLLAAHLIACMASGGDLPQGMFLDVVLLVAIGSLVGFDGEIKRTGGFDAK